VEIGATTATIVEVEVVEAAEADEALKEGAPSLMVAPSPRSTSCPSRDSATTLVEQVTT